MKSKSPSAMSRRRRTAVAVLCLASAAILVWIDQKRPAPTKPRAGQSEEQTEVDFQKYHAKTFKVAYVIDGDTIDIDVPDGDSEHTRIRLLGIDAPETHRANGEVGYFGPQAARFAKNLVDGKEVAVYLDRTADTRGYYGRLLAYIQLPDRTFLNEVIISEGYAYADLRFRHSNYQKYAQLDSAARGQLKGLWAEVTRTQLPQWLQRKKPTLLKAK